jgi:pimeloyl-ACP methyl ester carboxylesterase
MNTVRASSVESGGLRLAVTEEGDPGAPTVLFVHGFPDNSSVWDGVAGRLAERFHVVRYDVRGSGESEAPGGRTGYRLDRLAEDVVAVARATSPGRPVHLVGHDWGSLQGWQAITEADYQQYFGSYTSISGPCLDHMAYWIRDQLARRRYWPVVRQLLHSWYIAFFQLPVLPELSWRLPWQLRLFHARARDARNGIELYRANMLNRLTGRSLRRTSVPVQQISLTKDVFVTAGLLDAAQPWCDRLWRRELAVGHWAPRTHPGAISELISDFAAHVDGAPASSSLERARVVA